MWIVIIEYVGVPLSAIAGMAVILYYLFGEHRKWIGMAANAIALAMLVGAVICFFSSLHELVYCRLIKGDKSVGIMENLFSMLVYGGLAFIISCFFIKNYIM